MPAKKVSAKVMEGKGKKKGVKKTLKSVNAFLRKHKIISKGAKLVAPLSGKYEGKVRLAGKTAAALGYGLSPAGGGGLKVAGQGKKLRKYKKKG